MSDKQLTHSYLTLVEKLMNFIAHNGKGVKALPKDASFVAFSSTNSELNEFSDKILDTLKKEVTKKPIIKAEQQKISPNTWTFTTITP